MVAARVSGSVHPRTCGEHYAQVKKDKETAGSSPHLRGTLLGTRRWWRRKRFIPAPAGNTGGPGQHPVQHPVHPRTCGEHQLLRNTRSASSGSSPHCGEHVTHVSDITRTLGSSPHLRGTQFNLGPAIAWERFIPAPAGNTSYSFVAMYSLPVHPRTCGEHG